MLYKVSYAWNKIGDKVTCAWCGTDQKEIKNPKKHIEEHIGEDKKLRSAKTPKATFKLYVKDGIQYLFIDKDCWEILNDPEKGKHIILKELQKVPF